MPVVITISDTAVCCAQLCCVGVVCAALELNQRTVTEQVLVHYVLQVFWDMVWSKLFERA